jgi:hypothetical protein
MIDELIKYIANHPNLSNEISIEGVDVRQANRIKVSNEFSGYANFLATKVPTTITTNPAQNVWNRQRAPTTMDYTNDEFPAPNQWNNKRKKMTLDYANNPFAATDKLREIALRETAEQNTVKTDSTDQSDMVILDLEAELVKERANMESCLMELHKALAEEITKMKVEFNKQISESIENSEKRMTKTIQEHMGEMMHTSDAAILRIESKANEVADRLLRIMTNDNKTSVPCNNVTSPPRKQQCRYDEDNEMQDAEDEQLTPITPASPVNLTKRGNGTVAGEYK